MSTLHHTSYSSLVLNAPAGPEKTLSVLVLSFAMETRCRYLSKKTFVEVMLAHQDISHLSNKNLSLTSLSKSKMKVSVVLSFSLNFFFVSQSLAEKSITTSLQNGVRKTHESGELIFEDNFDFLDFDKWEHEITMAGGGNWEFQVFC